MRKLTIGAAVILTVLGSANDGHAVDQRFVTQLAATTADLQTIVAQHQQFFSSLTTSDLPTNFRDMYCRQVLTGRIGDLIHMSSLASNVFNLAFVMTVVSNPTEAEAIQPLLLTNARFTRNTLGNTVNTIQIGAQSNICSSYNSPQLTQNAVTALTNVSLVLESVDR